MEEWRDIKGYEGRYKVSNKGEIKSLNYRRSRKERILKQSTDSRGYKQAELANGQFSKKFLVHRLVAEAFIINHNNFKEINHKDEDKANNNVENLEWCDRKYNVNYGNVKKKISESNGRLIINEITGKIYTSSKDAERKTGISSSSIISCCNKSKYKSAGKIYLGDKKIKVTWRRL